MKTARLAIYIALALLLLSCGAGKEASLMVEFWAMGREGEVVQALVPEFERRNPGIRVRVQQIPWSAAHEKLLTAYAGDAMPDVFQLGNTWIPEFVALGAIAKLDERTQVSKAVLIADYFPGVLETNQLEGALYALPWYVDTRLLFYRKDSLEKAGIHQPPASWSAWIDAMQRIKQQSNDRFAILLPFNEWQPLVILALQLDAQLLKDNDQYANFSAAPFRQAFTFYLDMFRQGLAPSQGNTAVANLYQEFASGYFSMLITGPWNIGEFSRRLPANIPWLTAPMPEPQQIQPGVSLAGGASLVISRTSPHQDAAWKWLEYLSEPSQQLAFYRLTGDLPARKAAWQDQELANNPYVQAFWAQLQYVKSTPKIPEWERIAAKITQYAEAAIRNTMTVDEALTALDRDVDALLEKRRWLLSKARR